MRLVVMAALIGAVIASSITVARTPRAEGQMRLLVVPAAPGISDTRSAGDWARLFSKLVESGDFFSQVASRAAPDVAAAFPADDGARRSAWQSAVRGHAERDGLLQVSVADRDADRASRLAQAAADALVARSGDYSGGQAKTMLIDAPAIIRWPDLPNAALPAIFGAFLGGLAGFFIGKSGKFRKTA